ncbi:hypothetical protein SDC9_201977 [bioreactor metagenome]|uniref:Uncharacterized protein n=1 Tax=bioreactor metagenome TaxID=1076179 RepID=A0A645ISV1_9ZZZZ
MDVDLHRAKARHRLHRFFDVSLDPLTHQRYFDAVFHHDEEIDCALFLTNLHFDAFGEVLAAKQLGQAARKTAAHAGNAFNFHRRKARNCRHHIVRKGYAAVLFFPRVHIVCAQTSHLFI